MNYFRFTNLLNPPTIMKIVKNLFIYTLIKFGVKKAKKIEMIKTTTC